MSLIFFKYLCILNWMPATRFKHSGSGAAKDCKRCEQLLKHLFGSLHRWTGSLVTADSFMIGCRESFTSKDGVKHMIVQRRLLHVLRNTSTLKQIHVVPGPSLKFSFRGSSNLACNQQTHSFRSKWKLEVSWPRTQNAQNFIFRENRIPLVPNRKNPKQTRTWTDPNCERNHHWKQHPPLKHLKFEN